MTDAITNPVFTGGTGRSGTTIVGQLLGQHPAMALTKPAELNLITDESGLLTTVIDAGPHPPWWVSRAHNAVRRRSDRLRDIEPRDPVSPADRFAVLFERRWYPRIAAANPALPLSPEFGSRIAGTFARDYRRDRWRAARGLLNQVVDPMARVEQKRRWVDTTPPNSSQADRILQLYPNGRIINVIRDGRRVAYSMTRRSWAPDRALDALDLWRKYMLSAARALGRAPADRVLTVQLEDLVSRNRTETYEQILAFAELEDDEMVRSWFDRNVALDRSRPDLWQHCLDPSEIDQLNERYDRILHDLVNAGVRVPV